MSDPAVIDRCVSGAALAPLTGEQRQKLALLARRAYDRQHPDTVHRPPSTAFDLWRHAQVMQAVERAGIRECRQEDYDVVQAHFLRLLGQRAMAERVQIRAEVEPRRQALTKLRMECAAAADVIDRPEEYVAAIANARFKTRILDDLGEKQVWSLVFDLRRNAQRRRAKRRSPCPG